MTTAQKTKPLKCTKIVQGKISVGREEAMAAVISLSHSPQPTSHNETKCVISPKNTAEGCTCSLFKSCSVKPTL